MNCLKIEHFMNILWLEGIFLLRKSILDEKEVYKNDL